MLWLKIVYCSQIYFSDHWSYMEGACSFVITQHFTSEFYRIGNTCVSLSCCSFLVHSSV